MCRLITKLDTFVIQNVSVREYNRNTSVTGRRKPTFFNPNTLLLFENMKQGKDAVHPEK